MASEERCYCVFLFFLDVSPLTLLGNCSRLLVFLNYAEKKQRKSGVLYEFSLILRIQVH